MLRLRRNCTLDFFDFTVCKGGVEAVEQSGSGLVAAQSTSAHTLGPNDQGYGPGGRRKNQDHFGMRGRAAVSESDHDRGRCDGTDTERQARKERTSVPAPVVRNRANICEAMSLVVDAVGWSFTCVQSRPRA